jgi:hypothetical protein
MNPKSPAPPPASNPYQQPRQAAGPTGQLHRRPKFWMAIGAVWLATFACTSALSGGQQTVTTDTAAKKPVPTATVTTTATATATATAEPEPAPTVTETKKVTVHVTETVRSGGGGGGTAADTNSGSGHHGLPAGPPPGPDVDCSDLSGPVWVGGSDPHDLDRDGDGIGCDS